MDTNSRSPEIENPKKPSADPVPVPLRRETFDTPGAVMSASLDTRIKGYLSVRITFLGEPVKDLKVEFLSQDGSKTVDLANPQTAVLHEKYCEIFRSFGAHGATDDEGRYSIPFRVDVDTYLCRIEHQPDAVITTVEMPSKPFEIVLPVGRAYHDFYLDTFMGGKGT